MDEIEEKSVVFFEIDASVKEEIDHWLTKYPAEQKRSAVIAALLKVQEQNKGWLSDAAMDAVATYLGLSRIEVYEVATFYDMFELKPIGKHKINICANLPCMLRGSDAIVDALKERLGISPGQTTIDGKFTLRWSECLAACGGAPMCQVNDKAYHENLTPEKMIALIDQLEKEGE
jgi:NADH-quinone oxidoreductase subunit E